MSIERSLNWSMLALALLTAGCANSTASSKARVDASLTEECPPLSLLADGNAPTVFRWVLAAADAYADCSAKHRRLVEAVK